MILLTGSTRFDPEELILNQFPYMFIRCRHAHTMRMHILICILLFTYLKCFYLIQCFYLYSNFYLYSIFTYMVFLLI